MLTIVRSSRVMKNPSETTSNTAQGFPWSFLTTSPCLLLLIRRSAPAPLNYVAPGLVILLRGSVNRRLNTCALRCLHPGHGLVAEEQHACAGRCATRQPQRDRPGGLPEQPLPGAEHERVHEQPVLVHQVMLDQLLDQDPAP